MSFTIGTTSTGFWVLRILLSLSRILLVGALGTWLPRRNTSIPLMMAALFLVVLLVACCSFVVIGGFLFFNFRTYMFQQVLLAGVYKELRQAWRMPKSKLYRSPKIPRYHLKMRKIPSSLEERYLLMHKIKYRDFITLTVVFHCNVEDVLSFGDEDMVSVDQENEEFQDCEVRAEGHEGTPHEALILALGYLGVRDLFLIENVCTSLRSVVQNDPLLWRDIHINPPLNEKITDDVLLQITGRGQGSLQCLSLVDCQRITDEGLKRVVENNPKLIKTNCLLHVTSKEANYRQSGYQSQSLSNYKI
ncbi:hypothetical protein GOBAR_DD15206 [Gossypium barbadense]|nr:hypothetical protein GOBAR_DD15206 [Gossypium barbadense]